MNRAHVWVLASALSLSACNKKAEPAAAASASAPVASASSAPDTSQIPTPEDFEQTALDEINSQNLEQELDKLEKDIGK